MLASGSGIGSGSLQYSPGDIGDIRNIYLRILSRKPPVGEPCGFRGVLQNCEGRLKPPFSLMRFRTNLANRGDEKNPSEFFAVFSCRLFEGRSVEECYRALFLLQV